MTSYGTPKKNTAFILYVGLEDKANAGLFKAAPTLAAGDFKVSIDGGTLNNLTDLPTVTPTGAKMVKITLTAAEMNGDNVTVVCSDAAGAEWYDLIVNLQTTARQIDDLAYPTVSGRGLDVSATGEAGLDFDNIKAATGATVLTNITVPVVTTLTNHPDTAGTTTLLARVVGTLATGTHNPQTGDAYARIGAAGAGLTAIGDTRLANLDVTVSSRTKPADTQARVTLVDTATTLTNMPVAAPSTADIKTALETDGSKLDHLWEMTEDNAGTRRLTADALSQAPAGEVNISTQEIRDAFKLAPSPGAPAAGSIDKHVDDILNGLTGVGLIPLIYTVTEPGGVVPVEGVLVEVFTEEACLNCVRRGTTNSFGVVTFWMSTAGTYWLRSAKDGFTSVLDSEVVAA